MVIEWLESLRKQGMKLGLENTSLILSRLGNPQNDFPSIHVAGSNGKGTTCSILSNALSLLGLKIGLFTSPHLCNVEERIRIDGKQISNLEFMVHLKNLQHVCEITPKIQPTFYEATFIIAMMYFSSEKIDRAVIETGLGGRLDATRLVNADCCILTQISLEHTDILGETLSEIAREKSAIAREGIPLISTWNDCESVRKMISQAVSSDDLLEWYKPNEGENFTTEAKNLANLALTKLGYPSNCDEALKFTFWPGRMHIIDYSQSFQIILDCAHNPSGMQRSLSEIKNHHNDINQIIFGCTEQEDLDNFLIPLVRFMRTVKIHNLILCEPVGGRTKGVETRVLKKYLHAYFPNLNFYEEQDTFNTVNKALSFPSKSKLLCIGSLYLIGNILKILNLDDADSMTIFRK